jgi:CrcB protein
VIVRVLLAALGGGVGAALRYLSLRLVNRLTDGSFPLGVLAVNILGSFIIGLLASLFRADRSDLRSVFWVTGLLGGFTTFSSYILEAMKHFLNGRIGLGLLDMLLHNVLCLVFVALGLWLGSVMLNLTPK